MRARVSACHLTIFRRPLLPSPSLLLIPLCHLTPLPLSLSARASQIAATWDGTSANPSKRELALYVDGVLEQSGTEDDDDAGVPKTPEALGHTVVRTCAGGLCEEGMHIGGLYCCSGGGYSGRYLNGTLDEIRIWTRALPPKELQQNMYTPLVGSQQKGLLFYFPLDEAGMETGANVVESRALNWYGILGNAKGGGRPKWTVSDAPLSCTAGNRAPVCMHLAGQDGEGPASSAALPLLGGGGASAYSAKAAQASIQEDEDVSVLSVLFLVFLTMVTSGVAAATLTYISLKGEPPPFLTDLAARLNALLGRASYSPTSRHQPEDWRWAQPQRANQMPVPPAPPPPSSGGAPKPPSSYGGV